MRFRWLLSVLFVSLVAVGCGSQSDAPVDLGDDGSAESGATLSLSLSALTDDDLAYAGVESARVKVIQGLVGDEESALQFDSECIGYDSDRVRVTNLEPSDDYTIVVEMFGDGACSDLVLRGVRGRVTVEKSGNENSPYVIPMAEVDAFRLLPGRAGTGEGGHYPLAAVRRRAFHSATALGDGRVVYVGGAESNNGDQVIAGDGWPEVFDSRTMMFSRSAGAPLSGQRIMAHAAAVLPDGRLALAGGVEAVRFGVKEREDGRALTFDVPDLICYTADCDSPNYVQRLSIIDLGIGDVTPVPLTTARVFPTLDRIELDDGHAIVLAGGVPGRDDQDDYDAFACVYSSTGSIDCNTMELQAPRAGHGSACFGRDSDGDCTDLAYVQGVNEGQQSVEALDADGSFQAVSVSGGFPEERRLMARSAGADGLVFMTGGVEGETLSSGEFAGGGSIALGEGGQAGWTNLNMSNLPADADEIIFHQVTELPEGRVLVTGGLDNQLHVTDQAYILRAQGTQFVVEMPLRLNVPRMGHTATVIEGGPMAGAVIVLGGLTENADGDLVVADTAEILLPSSSL